MRKVSLDTVARPCEIVSSFENDLDEFYAHKLPFKLCRSFE